MCAFDKFADLGRSAGYWLSVGVFALLLLAVAVFFQYGLGTEPCVLCIQVRIWVAAIALLAFPACLARQSVAVNFTAHLLVTGLYAGLLDRSRLLFGTEKGLIFADCGFDPGLPDWFALDDWFPLLFQVRDSCGETPQLLFGVTMAEALLVLSVLLVSLGLSIVLSLLWSMVRASSRHG